MGRRKPRNAIDSNLPQWRGGKSPTKWKSNSNDDNPCACRNGSSVCDVGQTCLWMSVGCSLGCESCDGGVEGGTNPNTKDRCSSGLKPWTNNDPLKRQFNRECTGACIGSDKDGGRFNPWRAPGAAPTYDACGRAGGGPVPTAGHGEYVNTIHAKFGDNGSKVLPKQPSGAVWKAGSVAEAIWSIRANHGVRHPLWPFLSSLPFLAFCAVFQCTYQSLTQHRPFHFPCRVATSFGSARPTPS